MGMEGIGARVARKEDKRFITGKGRYTDDMVVAGHEACGILCVRRMHMPRSRASTHRSRRRCRASSAV
jgi:CO/xanthine dehydrogenase Mo-binding subunit